MTSSMEASAASLKQPRFDGVVLDADQEISGLTAVDVLPTAALTAFLEGRSDDLKSADIDPRNAECFARYERAMTLKRSGNLEGAAALLEQSCQPPSIYKGHYRELFKIWRLFSRADSASSNHSGVVARVRRMIEFDDQMIAEMLCHWGGVQQKQLPLDYFDGDRNLLKSDARALLKSGSALQDEHAIAVAQELLKRFGLELP
jgi:hypothetical protein